MALKRPESPSARKRRLRVQKEYRERIKQEKGVGPVTRWRRENRDKHLAWLRKYTARRRKELNEYQHQLRRRQKVECIERYGGKCVCCGEAEVGFLTIDHVNGDGAAHRRSIGPASIYRWLRANGFPGGFQVLCWNCNCGRQFNGGTCPHRGT